MCNVCICGFHGSVEVALLCSFLLGLGDSCFNTQLLSIVGYMFREDSAPAFAVFKFIQVGYHDHQPPTNLSEQLSAGSLRHQPIRVQTA